MKIQIAEGGLVDDSVVDGPGLRFSIFAQGCLHGCVGCHNPMTHEINGGIAIDVEDIIKRIKRNPLLQGITFTGGEPLLQMEAVLELTKEVKQLGLHVMMYTGFLWEDMLVMEGGQELLCYVDLLVDGRFELDKRDLSLAFVGSSNQRMIEVQESLRQNKVVMV